MNSKKNIENNPLLYIHIPFCDSKCNYCAFNSYTNLNHLKKEYFNAIKKQLTYEIEKHNIKKFKTIFIGGGTPSTMNIDFYEKLFTILSPYIKNIEEITIEANPSAKYEWIKEIKNFTTRISFGVQSFNEEKLSFLNRNHSKKDAINCVNSAFKVGFQNINIDLIYDVKGDNKKLLKSDLDIAFSLPINHISAYSLMIEENSKWQNQYQNKEYNEDIEIWFIEKIKEKFNQYEISNFGKSSIHNLGYWQLNNYIGIGSGAVGFIDNYRYYTKKDVYEYIKNPTNYFIEELSKSDLKEEKILLGLRSIIGFEEDILSTTEKKRVDLLIKENKLYKKENKIYNKDFLLADRIALFIIDNN